MYIVRPFDSGNSTRDLGWSSGLQLECISPQPCAGHLFFLKSFYPQWMNLHILTTNPKPKGKELSRTSLSLIHPTYKLDPLHVVANPSQNDSE